MPALGHKWTSESSAAPLNVGFDKTLNVNRGKDGITISAGLHRRWAGWRRAFSIRCASPRSASAIILHWSADRWWSCKANLQVFLEYRHAGAAYVGDQAARVGLDPVLGQELLDVAGSHVGL